MYCVLLDVRRTPKQGNVLLSITYVLQPGQPVRCGWEVVAKSWTWAPDQVHQHKQILEEKQHTCLIPVLEANAL